jgi:hypothetical protein
MRKLTLLFILVSLCWPCGIALAQDSDMEVFYHVGMWDAPRGKRAAFAQHAEQNIVPMLEDLFAKGVLVEWGFDANVLHDPDAYSHSIWWAGETMAKAFQVLDSYYGRPGAAEAEAALAALIAKHKDMTFSSEIYRSRASNLTSGYFSSSSWRAKRGHGSDFVDAWKDWAQPVYEQLLSDGVIVSYGLDSRYHHTEEDSLGSYSAWYIVEDLAAEEKIEAAFEAASEKESAVDRAAGQNHFMRLVVEGGHRDGMTRIHRYQSRDN